MVEEERKDVVSIIRVVKVLTANLVITSLVYNSFSYIFVAILNIEACNEKFMEASMR